MLHPHARIGPYTLISKLGQGAFGEVWLAERSSALITMKVAVKIPLDSQANSELIKQEAMLWVQASGHANILPIIEANIYDGHIAIVSEYAPDGSLAQWLSQHGGSAPSIDKAVEMTAGILAGLQHLHQRQIVHRDLKPPNILLQGDTPRLADFGISRVLSSSRSGTIAGTPIYMAPEAFNGERNEQTDIWSAGVVLYQLLCGRLPFPQTDLPELMAAIINKHPEPLPPSVPLPLQQVTLKALSKDPSTRFLRTDEMRSALRNAEKELERHEHKIQTNKTSESVIEIDPARQISLPQKNDLGRKSPSRRLWEALKEAFWIEAQSPTPTVRETIRNWNSLKTWTTGCTTSPKAWAFDGKTLAGFYDSYRTVLVSSSKLYLWHIPTGVPLSVLNFEPGSSKDRQVMERAAISPDARSFVSGVEDSFPAKQGKGKNTLRIWDTHTGNVVRNIKISRFGDIHGLTFSPSGRYLAMSFSDQIKIWDFKKDSISRSFPAHISFAKRLSFSPDEKLLAGIGGNLGLRLWHCQSGELQFSALTGKSTENFPAAFSPDANLLAITNTDRQIMIWHTKTHELVQVMDEAKFDGSFLSFSPDGLSLVCRRVETENLGLRFFDVRTREMTMLLDETKEVCWSTFSSDGQLLVTACTKGTMTLWKAE